MKKLRDCKEQMDPEDIQTIVYSVGKDKWICGKFEGMV